MPVTFRSGPRDPVTGQSSAVVSDPGNIVRASGQTDNERAARQASYNFYEPGQAGSPEVNQAAAERAAQRASVARTLGITDNNPYGNMSGLSRALGAENVSYAGNMSLNQRRGIANLMIDRYLDPVNPATGRVRPGLDAGDPTRFGPVESDPSLRRSYGIISAFPGVGLFTSMFDKSDLTVPGFTDYQNEQMSRGMAVDASSAMSSAPDTLVRPAADDPFSPERQDAFQAGLDEITANADMILQENAADRQLLGMSDDTNYMAQIPPAIPDPRIRDFQVEPTATTFDEPINPPIRTELNVRRTGAAPGSVAVPLPEAVSPLPEPSLPNLPTLDDAYSAQARQDLANAQRRRNDLMDFKMDILDAQPKAFEPRAPLPPSPPPPLPPMFNEQVLLYDPATYGLTGFRP